MAAVPTDDSPLSKRVRQPLPADTVDQLTNVDGDDKGMGRTASTSSTKVDPMLPSRSGTLKKKASLRKRSSLSRRGSMKSMRSMKGAIDTDDDGFNSVFHTPIPTQGNPTEVLANRFQAWRKLLKDLVTYFREIQASYEARSKSLLKVSNVINNAQSPTMFLTQGGLDDALSTLRGFHKISLTEANKSRDIEDDVIVQLNGLRSDLNQKIKEIKSLSGDFKNSVDKERETTRKAVDHYREALAAADADPASATGKSDPFIVRLAVDRQVERQIEEENYLHRAYLNLEGSGRELESIVVGEIQKAYNAYVGILRREKDHAQEAMDDLRAGPISMPKDHEWVHFVEHEEHFVNPNIPLRRLEDIYYPDKYAPAAAEIRAGMLERKSKYLKSYTPGWYVLSPTHLHEFKSADHIHMQQPVMSLCLLEQKLGSHSQIGASSHKFSLKGRQTGTMHRGHAWVFRAESYDTMMAWFEDIRALTEKTGAERSAFVRRHARSVSGESHRAVSVSSDGVDEDDPEPFAATAAKQDIVTPPPKRPSPGGRFPSDLALKRHLHGSQAPSSGDSSEIRDTQASFDGVDPPASLPAVVPPMVERQGPSVANNPAPLPPAQLNSQHIQKAQQDTQASVLGGKGDATNDYFSTIPSIGGAAGLSAAAVAAGTASATEPAADRATPVTTNDIDTKPMQEAQPLVSLPVSDTREATLPVIDAAPRHEEVPTGLLVPKSPLADDNSSIATTVATEIVPDTPGLRPTGQIFPSVLRHDTSMSVSKLHVPGEFPPPTPAERDVNLG